jgi:transketolase C-terminal domain/subunit
MTLWNVSDPTMASFAINKSFDSHKPNFIRFDRHALIDIYNNIQNFDISGDGYCLLKFSEKVLLISTGIMTNQSIKIYDLLKKENINIGVLDVYKFPLYENQYLIDILNNVKNIIILEENCMNGGLSDTISKIMIKNNISKNVIFLGLDNVCRKNIGNREYMRSFDNLDETSIKNIIKKLYD